MRLVAGVHPRRRPQRNEASLRGGIVLGDSEIVAFRELLMSAFRDNDVPCRLVAAVSLKLLYLPNNVLREGHVGQHRGVSSEGATAKTFEDCSQVLHVFSTTG